MGLTISHASALYITRILRADGMNLQEMDYSTIAHPSPWVGKRWSMREFTSDEWRWDTPSTKEPLHIVVRNERNRVRMRLMQNHICSAKLPADAILWLDKNTTISSPPLLFVQMAETLSLPDLVMLGYELCGNFTRPATNPMGGPTVDKVSAACTTLDLRRFVDSIGNVPGIVAARNALEYIADHAVSVPEAVLATMYSLPPVESGYGMGPVTLNERVDISSSTGSQSVGTRYPDLMFSFAPVGINYDGRPWHLDLDGLVRIAQRAALSNGKITEESPDLAAKLDEVRSKALDDNKRNRQLMSMGRIVFPVTKEDLYEEGNLDRFTRELLSCAHNVFGVNTKKYIDTLDDTILSRDRNTLLESLLAHGQV